MTATVELGPGELACSGCGRAVPAGLAAGRVILADPGAPTVAAVSLARCPGCAALDVTARALAGPDAERDATDRLARVLGCFRVLGRPLPDPGKYTAGEVTRWFGRWDVSWWSALSGQTVRPGHAAAAPWGHVGPELRAEIAEQFRRWMHVRARPGAPVPIRPTVGRGCVMCGVDAQTVPAERAHAVPDGLWRPVTASRASIGGTGGGTIHGALCRDCAAAASDGERLVLGPSVLEAALAAWWETHGETDAARWLRIGEYAGVLGWAVTGLPPSREPWSHMEIPVLSET